MGATQSASARPSHDFSTPPKRGLHVLRIAPNSPSARSDLEPFFDFVVGVDDSADTGVVVGEDQIDSLASIISAHEGRPLDLVVWSSKARAARLVQVTPSRAWTDTSAPSTSTRSPPLLGLTMRACNPTHALDVVWHVLDVADDSPGESAGLVPRGDWVVGWSGGPLTKEEDFYDVVEAHEDKPLRIYVYSYDFDTLREVVLVPNRHWGGTGLLGCEFGFGFLHRIPEVTSTVFNASDVGDMEEDDHGSAYYSHEPPSRTDSEAVFVPADAFAHSSAEVEAALRTANFGSRFDVDHGQDAGYAPYAQAYEDGNLPSGYPAIYDLSSGKGQSAFPTLKNPPPQPSTSQLVMQPQLLPDEYAPSPLSAQPATSPQDHRTASPGPPLRLQTDDLELSPTRSSETATSAAPQSSIVPRAPPPSAWEPQPLDSNRPIPFHASSLEHLAEAEDDATTPSHPTPPPPAPTAPRRALPLAQPTPKPIPRGPPSPPRTPQPPSRSATPTAPNRTTSPTLHSQRSSFGLGMNRAGMGFRIGSGNGFGQTVASPRWTSAAANLPERDRSDDLESVDGDTETEDGDDTETETSDGLE